MEDAEDARRKRFVERQPYVDVNSPGAGSAPRRLKLIEPRV